MCGRDKIKIRCAYSHCRSAIALITVALACLSAVGTQAQANTELLQAGQVISVDQPGAPNLNLDSGFTLLDSVDTHKDGQARPTVGAVSGNKSLDKEAQALQDAERAILARSKESAKESVEQAVANPVNVKAEVVVKEAGKSAGAEPARAAVNISKVSPAKTAPKPERTIVDRSAEVAQLQRDLSQERRQNSELSSELDKTRARLMTAETEVDRLSALLEGQDRRSAERFSPGVARAPQRSNNTRDSSQISSGAASIAPANAPQVGLGGELSIVTVAVEKAVARTAASRDSSPLMALNRGTKLIVESRSGEWLRVLTPAGVRVWVTADSVASGQAAVNRETAKSVAADAFGQQEGF